MYYVAGIRLSAFMSYFPKCSQPYKVDFIFVYKEMHSQQGSDLGS